MMVAKVFIQMILLLALVVHPSGSSARQLPALSPHGASSQGGFGHRALLAEKACSSSSSKLLINGYFNVANINSMNNALVAATMANDAYPWAKQFGFSVIDVVAGLTDQQNAEYQRMFSQKYAKLGATSVQFAEYHSPDMGVSAYAIVIGTPNSVFVVHRGTCDIGQVLTTTNISAAPTTVFGKTLEMFQAPFQSTMGIYAKILAAVNKAVSNTDSPSTARVFLTGHSLGGASATFAALLLKEQGFNIGGVWAFAPYKTGMSCAANEDCWTTVYDKHLGAVTWSWWNNQDPIPALLDSVLGTTFADSVWGHVPAANHWMRVIGDNCLNAGENDLMTICPPAVDAADGAADGQCTHTVVEAHLPWVYLQKVAHCTLLGNQRDPSAARMDQCGRNAVWSGLLGLPVPERGFANTVNQLGGLAASEEQSDKAAAAKHVKP